MPAQSPERLLAEYGMQICGTHPQLKNRTMRHEDSRQSASTGLVFSATRGTDRVDGAKGCDMTLTVEYRSSGDSAQQNALVASAIDETFSDDYARAHIGQTKAEELFEWLIMTDDRTSDESHTKNLRKFTRTISFIVKPFSQ